MSGDFSSTEAPQAAAPAAVSASVVTEEELGNLVPEWERLAAEAVEPNPFYEHWLLRPALKAYAGAGKVECVAVREDGRLVAFAPVERIARWRGMPVPGARTWRHRHCVLGTPLVHREASPASVQALWQAAGAAVMEFDYVRAGAGFHAALADALAEGGATSATLDPYTRAVLVRGADAESYLQQSLSAGYRKQLRRLSRRLSEQGRLEHVALEKDGDVARWIGEFLALEAQGWKGRLGSALACSEADRGWAEQVFRAAFARGRFIAIGLDLDGRPIARQCGFAGGDGSFLFKTAYDEALARFSPGVLAELDWIRRVHSLDGVRWTDSFTAPGNTMIRRLWKDACIIQRVAVATGRRGEIALAALPLARLAKRIFRK